MALVVEDGGGNSLANAYISVAYADTYHSDRGHTNWTGTNEQKEASIIRATDYLDKRFGRKFRGTRQSKSQALEWPRLDALDNDGYLLAGEDEVPRNLQKACAEYALRALTLGELSPDPLSPVPSQNNSSSAAQSTDVISGFVKAKTEKVGPIETSTEYETSSQTSTNSPNRSGQSILTQDQFLPQYPAADLWIEELIKNPLSVKLVRG